MTHSFAFVLGAAAVLGAGAFAQTPRLDQVDILRAEYPRVFFFRSAETFAVRPTLPFEAWDKTFSRLMGIEGKVLDEEVGKREARNIDFFSRFKDAHPHQLVLEHYNGLGRDPRNSGSRYFAGHWIYFGGETIKNEVPAQGSETTIELDDVRSFRTDAGRMGSASDDIGLCELDASGKPDWTKSEQVKLIEVNQTKGKKSGTIRVQRGLYGTAPRAFVAGKSYAAVHAFNGPWGKTGAPLWYFNFSSTCPRDAKGHTCAEVLADEFAELFGKGGRLEKFDGLEFDVMRHSLGGRTTGVRVGDVDADGKADGGIINGRDVYAEGTMNFCKLLRSKLGPDRIIMADGWNWDHVRAFDSLNGMESEGWPKLGDPNFNDWCGGLNRAAFWNAHSAAPRFNYINHKLLAQEATATAPYPYHRLVFAGAMLTDSALCNSLAPPLAEGELFGVWDEFWQGAEHKLGWLGQPKTAPVHLGFTSPDTLGGLNEALLKSIATENAKLSLANGLHVTGKEAGQELASFKLSVPASANGELLLHFTVSASDSATLPNKAPRILRVGLVENRYDLSASWIDSQKMDYTFYATGVPTDKPVEVTFDIEGSEEYVIHSLNAHAHADAIVREFDHGVVLANPSAKSFAFELAKLFPGQKLRRIQATALQDKETNNGQPVGDSVTVGARDALFLVK